MNTKTLIDHAVMNTTAEARKGLAERLFTVWFNRLVYAQIWEDPIVDIAALGLKPGATIVTIASGDCNALAYLATQPQAVHAIDLNGTHLAMLAHKRAALAHLSGYAEVLSYLGDANHRDNLSLYRQHIAPALDANSRAFWEQRNWLGQARYTYFSKNVYQQGLLGDFIGLSHRITRLLGGNLAKMREAKSAAEQRQLFDKHVSPLFDHWLVRWLCRQPMMLYSLGIPPSQFDALKRDAADGLHETFRERMRRLACDWPIHENCFAGQAFGRAYDTTRQSALPMYLQQAHYDTIRSNLDKLHSHHTTVTDFLQTQTAGSVDAYLFLDAQDWMDARQLTALWQEVSRTAAPAARVVFRTGGEVSPLESALPAHILKGWRTNAEQNLGYFKQDRSAIYGGLHLYERV